MQATHLSETMIESTDDDDDDTIADVCVRDKEAPTLLRPLENESAPVLATASGSPSGSDSDSDDVRNSIHRKQQNATAKVIVDQEPDRASPAVSLTKNEHQQHQQQSKHGNQTNESEGSANIIYRLIAHGSAMSSPSAGYLDIAKKKKKEIDQIIIVKHSKGGSGKQSPARSHTIAPDSMGGDSATASANDSDAETLNGSELPAYGQCSPSVDDDLMLQQQSNYEAETLRIVQSLNEQRMELQDIDRQLSGLIESHLRSIGRSCSDAWCSSLHQTGAMSFEPDGRINQVIDLTTSGRANSLDGHHLPDHQSEQQAEGARRATTSGGNLGQLSSVNLRKSRLLSATLETQQARAENILPNKRQRELPHYDHHMATEKGSCALPLQTSAAEQRKSCEPIISPKRSLAPEMIQPMDCSSELTHDLQKLKRLKWSSSSGHSAISSSGASFSDSSSSTTTNCNQSPSAAAAAAAAAAENNVDLLRDFMLHNQYLPSHLVLECLSQCQKQTSGASLSSILLPSAMALIDGSTSPSSFSSSASTSSTSTSTSTTTTSTARNQTQAGSSSAGSAQQQIDQLEMIATQQQRGSFSPYHYHQSNAASLVGADQQQAAEHQLTAAARSRAFVLATSSHLASQQSSQLSFASHHNNHHNGNSNSSSSSNGRPPNADYYHLPLPMTRHNSTQLHGGSQETLELIRATMANKGQQQQLQQHNHHHHHLISMADFQRVAFKCHVCGSGFEDRHRLQQHLSIHLNLQPSWFEERTIAETMAQYESKRGDYLCTHCDIRFETTAEFDKHMQAHGDKPHRCDLCSQDNKQVSFRYYRQLLTHLRSHCFLYSCRFAPDCKQTSNRKDYLKLHILKHHLNNQLPKQYTICCH